MTIVDVLEQNSRSYGDEVCLVEINPEVKEIRRVTWKEYELIEPNPMTHYRREITWRVFDEKANRFANLLICKRYQEGGQGGNSVDELSGMAADLFWNPENRSACRSAEFPLCAG